MQSKTNSLLVLLIAGALLLVSGFLVNRAAAEALPGAGSPAVSTAGQDPECWPLDVVVLIDQSTSMWEASAGGNDLQGYRFLATKEILNLLISNRRAQCTEAVHRFGVIVFSHYSKTAVSLVPVDILPKDERTVWSQSIVQAIDGISEYKPKPDGTEPKLAFDGADEMLVGAKKLPTPVGYGPRRQVVILLTDGNPIGRKADALVSYMRTLSQSLSTSNWANKRSIWIVALNATEYLSKTLDDKTTMRQVWSDIATTHNGRLLGADSKDNYSEQTIPAALGEIIDAEFGQPGVKIQCGDFYVDPYLQSVRFVFSKNLKYQDQPVILQKRNDATKDLLYEYRNGEAQVVDATFSMTLRAGTYRRDSIIEEYTVDFPVPGLWRFDVDGLKPGECLLGVDARQTSKVAEVYLAQPQPTRVIAQNEVAPYYDTEVPLPFQVQLKAADGTVLPPLSDYPLTLKANLGLPDGGSKLPDGSVIPEYTFTQPSKGLWQSESPILAPAAGTYNLTVVGTSVHGVSLTLYPVFTTKLSYDVKKLGRLRFEIQSPTAGQSLPCNTVQDLKSVGNPIPITIKLLDPTGQPADAGFYLTSTLTQSFEATFLDAGKNPLDVISLAPAARGGGVFEGTLLGNQPAVVGCGSVSAQVMFKGGVTETLYVLPLRTQTVTFNRPQSEGVLIAVTAPITGQRFLLHPNFWAAQNADSVDPVKLAFALTDLAGKSMLPIDAAKSTPEALYTARLLAPDGASEALTLTLNGGTFSASGGLTLTQEGIYTFEIATNHDAFKDGYISGNKIPVTVSFERYDTLFTKPETFRTVAISSAALMAFLIGLAIYLLTGTPGGMIEITEFGRPQNTLAGPFALRGGRFPTIKGRGLPGLGIKHIKTKKAKSSEGGFRAAQVVITGINGQPMFESILEVDKPAPVAETTQDIEIVYH